MQIKASEVDRILPMRQLKQRVLHFFPFLHTRRSIDDETGVVILFMIKKQYEMIFFSIKSEITITFICKFDETQ